MKPLKKTGKYQWSKILSMIENICRMNFNPIFRIGKTFAAAMTK
jgi:hypothetical protein